MLLNINNFGRVTALHRKGRDFMKRSISFLTFGTLLLGGTFLAPAHAAVAKDGEPVYTAKCANCHAADGAGKPAIAKMMNVTMKPLGSAEVQAKSDADLKRSSQPAWAK